MLMNQRCRWCGSLVKYIFTDHKRPGTLNTCEYCTSREAVKKSRSLKEINDERRRENES